MTWHYGDIVRLRPDIKHASDGRWMILGPYHVRYDSFFGIKLPAICIVPPSEAWMLGDVDGVWIRQMEKAE